MTDNAKYDFESETSDTSVVLELKDSDSESDYTKQIAFVPVLEFVTIETNKYQKLVLQHDKYRSDLRTVWVDPITGHKLSDKYVSSLYKLKVTVDKQQALRIEFTDIYLDENLTKPVSFTMKIENNTCTDHDGNTITSIDLTKKFHRYGL